MRRKSRAYSKGALISHLTIISLIVGMVLLSYQAPTGVVLNSAQTNQEKSIEAPTVDQVSSAALASVAAQSADISVSNNVVNLSRSLDANSAAAQSSDVAVVNKPQIVSTTGSQRGVIQYVTKQGDTVQSVAKAHGISEDSVRWANNLVSDVFSAGTTLKLPSVTGLIYTVKEGDSADSIASKYGSSASRITTYNDAELTGVQPGQQIIIPGGVLPQNERPGARAAAAASTPSYSAAFGANGAVVGNRYDYGYCTWYVYNKRAQIGRPVGSFWGNAVTWASYARGSGYTVNNTPAPGAVLQNGGGYGHVAFVERINPDGSVYLTEMNYVGWNVISSRTLSPGEAAGYNYIH